MPTPRPRRIRGHIPWEPSRHPELRLEVPDWTSDALCTEVGGDIFFPEKGEPSAPAKRVCRACPVVDECLEWALINGERFGVFGGLSERERRALQLERELEAA